MGWFCLVVELPLLVPLAGTPAPPTRPDDSAAEAVGVVPPAAELLAPFRRRFLFRVGSCWASAEPSAASGASELPTCVSRTSLATLLSSPASALAFRAGFFFVFRSGSGTSAATAAVRCSSATAPTSAAASASSSVRRARFFLRRGAASGSSAAAVCFSVSSPTACGDSGGTSRPPLRFFALGFAALLPSRAAAVDSSGHWSGSEGSSWGGRSSEKEA
mmetsp:Transcript_26478/g.45594  ORF Transcript_26478/g.45594 Transcript_26478/m.45594 type:complete len:218 (+) Transcript_26478:469-1122(+)